MDKETILYCTVCEAERSGKYCSECGQRIVKQKTTLFSVLNDIVSSAIDVEKSVFATMIQIITNPKKIIKNYTEGYRKYYPSPGKFLLYALAIAAFQISYIREDLLGMKLDVDYLDSQVVFWLLILPLISLSSYIVFLKKRISFAEHVIANLYIGSTFFIVMILVDNLVVWLFKGNAGLILLFLFLLLSFLWSSRTYSSNKTGIVLLNGLLMVLVFASIIAVLVLLTALLNGVELDITE